jgi:hypothetical protein
MRTGRNWVSIAETYGRVRTRRLGLLISRSQVRILPGTPEGLPESTSFQAPRWLAQTFPLGGRYCPWVGEIATAGKGRPLPCFGLVEHLD